MIEDDKILFERLWKAEIQYIPPLDKMSAKQRELIKPFAQKVFELTEHKSKYIEEYIEEYISHF